MGERDQFEFIREVLNGGRCADCGEQHSPDFDCTYERRKLVETLFPHHQGQGGSDEA